jgi:hypothetical protein
MAKGWQVAARRSAYRPRGSIAEAHAAAEQASESIHWSRAIEENDGG